MVDLRDALEHVGPALPQAVAVVNSQVEQLSDAVDVLLLDLFGGRHLGELTQRAHEGITDLLDLEMAADPDGVHEALQAEVGDNDVVGLFEYHRKHSEVGHPSVLEHRSNGRDILDQHELVVAVLVLLQDGGTSAKEALPLFVKENLLVSVALRLQLQPGLFVLFQSEGLLLHGVVDLSQEFIEVEVLLVVEFSALGDLAEVFQFHPHLLGLGVVDRSLKHHSSVG
mmetsp:Transcript_20573/g.31353  ORF Transcript_20573/g.31353 Transcript_20573/m.31353 type:complete len:226 (-) Transcript_20573:1951-2628(-)